MREMMMAGFRLRHYCFKSTIMKNIWVLIDGESNFLEQEIWGAIRHQQQPLNTRHEITPHNVITSYEIN